MLYNINTLATSRVSSFDSKGYIGIFEQIVPLKPSKKEGRGDGRNGARCLDRI